MPAPRTHIDQIRNDPYFGQLINQYFPRKTDLTGKEIACDGGGWLLLLFNQADSKKVSRFRKNGVQDDFPGYSHYLYIAFVHMRHAKD